MKKLDKLNEIADEMFEKIEPSATSWAKINQGKYAKYQNKTKISTRRVVVFACALALVFFSGYNIIKMKGETKADKDSRRGSDNNAMQLWQ